ncbi:MAG: FkbM family methyltransferase [Bacteroidetes bacterium]|nr:MAG: FkbM family methyltransferase [Bacteroidota bacterium]
MLKKIIHRILFGPKSDTDKLISSALGYPRYQHHQFKFRDYDLEVSDFLSVAYQLKEYFHDQRLSFLSSRKDPIILDCGANVGVSVLYFKSIYPQAQIKAYEPDPAIFNYLQNNLEKNQITDVELHRKAVWIDENGVEFGSEGADGGSVFFNGNRQKLESISLKQVLENHEQIDLLKMDIEGAEVQVLDDCRTELHKVRFLFVEYHSWKGQKQELDCLLNVLSENGFRYQIESIGKSVSKPFGEHELSGHPMDVQLDIYAINERL